MHAASNGIVNVFGLTKKYGDHLAIDNISFRVTEGHTLALLGPSGCGKTTVLRCLAGLEKPQAGLIEIAGQVVFDSSRGINLPSEQRNLGVVFQSYAVWPHMTVAENIGFPLQVRHLAKSERDTKVRRMLEIVGLSAMADRPATQLSGGQQQRIALGRALVHEPKLVLFDEALSNLDALLREQMRMELKLLQDRLHFTALYVTHDQAEAFCLAERLVVMNSGRVETEGPPRDVFRRPATPFMARFFGLNVMEGEITRSFRSADARRGERYAEVKLHDESIIWGTLAHDQDGSVGAKVLACVRKEHVRLDESGTHAGEEPPALMGQVRAASFMGLTEEYVISVGGAQIRSIQTPRGHGLGDHVKVVIRPEDCAVLGA